MSDDSALFEVERHNETAIVVPTRNLGELRYEQLVQEATDHLEAFGKKQDIVNVVIDFHRTDYIGSTALGFLVTLWKTIRERGGHMALCCISEHEQEILRLTKLDSLWPVFASRDDALAALAQPAE